LSSDALFEKIDEIQCAYEDEERADGRGKEPE
jgi:hypothetical protein